MSYLFKSNISVKKTHVSKFRQQGQGMSEYLIIVALIAVAAIGVVGYMGDTVSNQMAGMAKEIAGESGTSDQTAASKAAKQASATAGKHKTMANYASDNGQ